MGQLGGEASIVIDLPIEALWPIVEDVEGAPAWQDGLDSVEVLERDGDGRPVVANSTTDAKVRMVTTRVRFSYDAPHTVRWEQEKGDLKSLVGSWELEDLGDGTTKATYRLDGDPGRMLGMLIRGPVQDRLQGILVDGRPGELAAHVASR